MISAAAWHPGNKVARAGLVQASWALTCAGRRGNLPRPSRERYPARVRPNPPPRRLVAFGPHPPPPPPSLSVPPRCCCSCWCCRCRVAVCSDATQVKQIAEQKKELTRETVSVLARVGKVR
jgi:hypothetical protein